MAENKAVVAPTGDAGQEQPVTKLTAAQKKAAEKAAAAEAEKLAEAEAENKAAESAEPPVVGDSEAEAEKDAPVAAVAEETPPPADDAAELEYPVRLVIQNNTYTSTVYPELGGVVVAGGASVEVTVKDAATMAILLRNVDGINTINQWEAPRGIFIAVPVASDDVE